GPGSSPHPAVPGKDGRRQPTSASKRREVGSPLKKRNLGEEYPVFISEEFYGISTPRYSIRIEAAVEGPRVHRDNNPYGDHLHRCQYRNIHSRSLRLIEAPAHSAERPNCPDVQSISERRASEHKYKQRSAGLLRPSSGHQCPRRASPL